MSLRRWSVTASRCAGVGELVYYRNRLFWFRRFAIRWAAKVAPEYMHITLEDEHRMERFWLKTPEVDFDGRVFFL